MTKQYANVSLSHDEYGLLLSAISSTIEELEDLHDIQTSIMYSSGSFFIAGSCQSTIESLEKLIADYRRLEKKLKFLKGGKNNE